MTQVAHSLRFCSAVIHWEKLPEPERSCLRSISFKEQAWMSRIWAPRFSISIDLVFKVHEGDFPDGPVVNTVL